MHLLCKYVFLHCTYIYKVKGLLNVHKSQGVHHVNVSQIQKSQEFLFNWGEIRGSKGAKAGPFFLLQNRFGTTAAFDVCFGSSRPTLEYVLGRPTVTCLQAKSQFPGSDSSLIEYFREQITTPNSHSALPLLQFLLSSVNPLSLIHLSQRYSQRTLTDCLHLYISRSIHFSRTDDSDNREKDVLCYADLLDFLFTICF